MADQGRCHDVQLLKNTKISVFVDEALPDLLVCTYEFGVKIFKGVLLDATKRHLPCGVQSLNPTFTTKPEEDSLYSVNQRFAYLDPQNQTSRKNKVHISSKYKNNKMTVRLRPRQVLCSKCKGICNENSENVSRKRKNPERVSPVHPIAKRSADAPVTRSVQNELNNKKKLMADEKQLLDSQKTSRITSQEISKALSGNVNKLNIDNNMKKPLMTTSNLNIKYGSTRNNLSNIIDDKLDNSHSFIHSEINVNATAICEKKDNPTAIVKKDPEILNRSIRRILRKKRSVGSMEDLWDETVFEENKLNKNINNEQNNVNADSNVCPNTRTIKISYGPQGEGTVLKIPAQIENLHISDESEENSNSGEPKNKINKAARKALKKAKKEAKKKVQMSITSPIHLSVSPNHSILASSPRYTVGSASPRHGLGCASPKYDEDSNFTTILPRKRKHKMKHKKKHKDDKDRKHKDGEIVSDEGTKEPIVTQKLSINLKRLNNVYTSVLEKADESSSDEQSEQVPDFPPPNPPLMLRINAKTVSSAQGADGGRLLVGDVVWGKIQGFPWWPGKVLTITNSDNQLPQAHVAWYGSSTSSLIQCDQLSPYLENFKIRYNKKKRGTYKEAIRQATTEARENADSRLKNQIISSPAHSIMNVVPPTLASPREIDVVS